MYVVANGNVGTFTGPGSGGGETFTGVGNSGTLSIVLDTRAINWKATYYVEGSALRTNVFSGTLNITHVGFGGYPTSNLEVDNFILEEEDAALLPPGVLLSETFSADGSLAGRSVEIGYETWIAHADLQTTNGVALPAATSPGKNGLLPFTPQTGTVYTLSADIAAISGSWAALGFVADTDSTIYGNEPFYAYVDTEAPWMYVVPAGNVQTFAGPSTGGVLGFSGVGSTGKLSIVLDTTETNWKAIYSFNGTALRTNVFSGSLNITHVGFGGNPVSNIEVDNFKLEFPYVPGPLEAATLEITMSNNTVVVSSSDLSADYTHILQVTDDLVSGVWSNLTPSVSNATGYSWGIIPADDRGFYQILSQ
jgi:hypothetical protein